MKLATQSAVIIIGLFILGFILFRVFALYNQVAVNTQNLNAIINLIQQNQRDQTQ